MLKKLTFFFFLFPILLISQNNTQEIELEEGWSIFSTYIIPENNNLEDIFASIIDDVIIIKDENGNAFWPEFNLNSIGQIQLGDAYLIKMQNPNNLSINGTIGECNSVINLESGWNLLGYLDNVSSDLESHFSNLLELIILKDDEGNIYWPLFSLNTMQELKPGKGYQIKLNSSIEFNYNCNNQCIEYNYSCNGGTWQTEVYWEIQNDGGEIIYSGGAPEDGILCLNEGCYTILTSDSYGDGWQGNNLNISGLIYTNENLDGCSSCGLEIQTFELCIPFDIIYGCTDPIALNYNSVANTEDNSCLYPEQSLNMELIAIYDYEEVINDIWGYSDNDGNEYALVGTNEGFSVLDITIPENPVQLYFIEGDNTIWRDIKTWQNYAYVICDGCNDGLLIVDLNDITGNTYYTSTEFFEKVHNIYIDENGYLYAFGGNANGVMILNLSDDPINPTYEGVNDLFYLHDGMVRGDTIWGASTSMGEFFIYDASDKSSPTIISSQPTPGGMTHNCWISNDGSTLFTTQEYSGAYIRSYDVSDIYNIEMQDEIQSWSGFTDVIPHNTHVLNNYLVNSYYTDGITIIDASDPNNLIEVGYYDTSTQFEGDGSFGCWGAYPYLQSGLILATDRQNGLHILNTSLELLND